MPKLCERFKKGLQKHCYEKLLPFNGFAIIMKVNAQQQINNYNCDLASVCQEIHRYYIKEQKRQCLVDTQQFKFMKPEGLGLIALLPKPKQQYFIASDTYQSQGTQAQCIHSLQLLGDEAETQFFSLDDVETTYSSYMEDHNYSFIDDSIMLSK